MGRNCSHGQRFWSWWTAERTVLKSLCLGWEGWIARLRVLEACRSWSDGRLQPITLSAEQMICCSLPLSLAVEEAYQMVTEKVRMESMMAYKGTIILFGRLTSSTGLLWWESWCSASTLDPGKWWFPGSSRTSLCWWWSHPWWRWVWLCSFWRPQSSPPF